MKITSVPAIAAFAFFGSGCGLSGAAWQTDAEAAFAQAKKENRPVMIAFVGSDWCHYCEQLEGEVFSTAQFKDWSKKVVALKIDSPRRKELPADLKAQNDQIKAEYGVSGFPTVVFADPSGKVLGMSGYMPGGPGPWVEHAERAISAMPTGNP